FALARIPRRVVNQVAFKNRILQRMRHVDDAGLRQLVAQDLRDFQSALAFPFTSRVARGARRQNAKRQLRPDKVGRTDIHVRDARPVVDTRDLALGPVGGQHVFALQINLGLQLAELVVLLFDSLLQLFNLLLETGIRRRFVRGQLGQLLAKLHRRFRQVREFFGLGILGFLFVFHRGIAILVRGFLGSLFAGHVFLVGLVVLSVV